MYKILLLLAFVCLGARVAAQSPPAMQKVTISFDNDNLVSCLDKLTTATHVHFYYEADALKQAAKKFTATYTDQPLGNILRALFARTNFVYQEVDGKIVIKKTQPTPEATTPGVNGAGPKAKRVAMKGTMVNIETGTPIPGAVATVAATGKGVVADDHGEFIVMATAGDELRFSSVGYRSAFMLVKTDGPLPDIKLYPAHKRLDSVVVVSTALGLRRTKRSLGYSTQEVNGSEVSDAPTNGFINALSGKISGLNLTRIGGPMGSSNVVLRGEGILDFSANGALIVIDGVPVSSGFVGTGNSSYLDSDSPLDFGSSLTDLNPDDIESINVLKGPAAAALYGNRALNGAIIVKTKSGEGKAGYGVSYSSNVALDEINHWPDFQYKYGAGLNNANYYSYGATQDGASTSSTSSAYGPKFAGQSFYQYNSPKDPVTGKLSARVPWVPYTDNRKDFFQTGVTTNNNIAISGGTDKASGRASLSYLQNNWIMPNTGYQRYTLTTAGTIKASNRLTLSTNIIYTNKIADNLPSAGYNDQSIAYFMIGVVPNASIKWYKPYWVPGEEGVVQNQPFSTLQDNPYLIVYEMINASNRNNITGNIKADYKLASHLDLMIRGAIDGGYEFRSQRRPMDTQKWKQGMYSQQTSFNWQNNNDFLIRWNQRFKDFSMVANAGGNTRKESLYFTNQVAPQLQTPNEYNLANSKGAVQTTSDRAFKTTNSLYGFLNLSWRNEVFLDITGRNDWSSSLPLVNNSFFYPSFTGSAILSELLHLPSWVSYAKLRGSYASVGYDAKLGTYSLQKEFVAGSLTGTVSNPSTIPNPNLKPQINHAIELGMEWHFFSDRITFDGTVYHQNTINQILNAPIDPATGYATQLMNLGKVTNQGIELTVTFMPVKTKDFSWKTNINWSMNRNKVLNIGAVGGSVVVATGPRGTLEAHEGRPMGDLYGIGYQRAPNGQILFDSGLAQRTDTTKLLGNVNPSWRGGIGNTFTYKGLSLSILFDMRIGGAMYSLTHAVMAEEGKSKATLPGRDNGIVGKGQMLDASGKYVPNNVVVTNSFNYYDALWDRDVVEGNVFSDTWVKLREVTLSYTVPSSFVQRTRFLREASIGIYGRDLFVWTKFPAYDPETATLNNNSIIPGFETGQFPSTRTLGMNVRVSF